MKQPEALRLAGYLDDLFAADGEPKQVAAELRRLHEANQAMLSALKDARNQLESYELELNGDSYNDLTINAAIAKGEQA